MVGPFTEFYNTPNKSFRQNVPRLGVVLHHAAMTNLDTLIYLEMGAKQVSSSATCKDDRLPQMMPFDLFRAWSLSDAYWDSALRSVETCNESTDGWTVSDASHWSLARAVAYWADRDGFWPHRDGDPQKWTVLGHREMYIIHDASYATACPGGMDLNLVTRRAQDILRSGTAGGGNTPIEKEYDMVAQYPRSSDARITAKNPTITIKPKESTNLLLPNGQAKDITSSGDVGRALLTGHVYAKGTPGEAVDVKFIWYNIKDERGSSHFTERAEFDKDGTVMVNPTFQSPKAAGQRIYFSIASPSSNTQPFTVSVFSADAALLSIK